MIIPPNSSVQPNSIAGGLQAENAERNRVEQNIQDQDEGLRAAEETQGDQIRANNGTQVEGVAQSTETTESAPEEGERGQILNVVV